MVGKGRGAETGDFHTLKGIYSFIIIYSNRNVVHLSEPSVLQRNRWKKEQCCSWELEESMDPWLALEKFPIVIPSLLPTIFYSPVHINQA
jgi:hypothetical protein